MADNKKNLPVTDDRKASSISPDTSLIPTTETKKKVRKAPKVKKQKRITIAIDPIAFASLTMALVMTVLIVVGWVQLNNIKQEVQTMTAYVEVLQAENVQLQNTFLEGYDIEQIERTALALGMVPKEQVQHISVQLPEMIEQPEPTTWERFTTFLTGLFA